MDCVEIKGSTGMLLFDFTNEKININRGGARADMLRMCNIEIPFSDITGIEMSPHSMLKLGTVWFIVNDKRIMLDNNQQIDATMFPANSKNDYLLLEETVKRLMSLKPDIELKGQNGFTNVEKALASSLKTTSKEYHVRCNSCGHIFCYTQGDLDRNVKLAKQAFTSSLLSVGQAFAGTVGNSQRAQMQADGKLNQIVDYNKCPHCGSVDITKLTDAEWEQAKTAQNAPATPTISAADELKKFKELLDMGVITEEEFNEKKKQLLGL